MTEADQQHAARPTMPEDPPAAAPGTVDPHLLQQLADAHGVGTSFQGWDGLPHSVAEGTLIKVLAALGVEAHTNQHIEAALAEVELAPWRRMLPAAVVIMKGEPDRGRRSSRTSGSSPGRWTAFPPGVPRSPCPRTCLWAGTPCTRSRRVPQ